MSKLSSDAYSAAFTAIFRSVKSLYPKFDIGKLSKPSFLIGLTHNFVDCKRLLEKKQQVCLLKAVR